MRLFAALGPGDLVGAHRSRSPAAFSGETSVTFSEQLVSLCKTKAIELLGVGSNGRIARIEEPGICLEQAPKPFARKGGFFYHLSSTLYAGNLAWKAFRFKADLAIVDSGSCHYFALLLFYCLRIPLCINFHNVLWPHGFMRTGAVSRILRKLDGLFFRHCVVAIMGCSPECARQANELARRNLPYFEWRGQFSRQGFPVARAHAFREPFRLAYVGRVEENKGGLDVPRIASLARERGLSILFHICGDGSSLHALRSLVSALGVQDIVVVHGRLRRHELLRIYGEIDAVVVPTRGTFSEGMPLVCAEAVISGLPIITSVLSNALPILGPAIVEARPESIPSFVDAIEFMVRRPGEYSKLVYATEALAEQFFDRERSFAAAVDRMIYHVTGRPPLREYTSLFQEAA